MKSLIAAASSVALVAAGSAAYVYPAPRHNAQVPLVGAVTPPPPSTPRPAHPHALVTRRAPAVSNEALTAVVKTTCATCHSERQKSGNLVLANFDVGNAASTPETAEKMIAKLRAGMMPPPGRKRPGGDTLVALAETLERLVDRAASAKPEPGTRSFQRLNRAEYERSIRDLLTLEVDAGKWLPLDTKSANFDNIADAQTPSATVLDAYLDAASEVSRLAVGDPKASVSSTTYKQPRLASQWDQVDGAPIGTRGGIAATHNFPADGEYVFTILLHAIPTGQLFGSDAPFDEKLEVSINGERIALLDIDRWSSQADPNGLNIKTNPIPVRAGPQRVAAAFLKTFDGPVNDLIAPIGHSIADTQIGSEPGITNMPHLSDLVVTGPYNPTGVSDTPARRRIFACRPTTPNEARPCAEKSFGRGSYRAGAIQRLSTAATSGRRIGLVR